MKKIKDGVYLVLNPSIGRKLLIEKLKQALEGGIVMLQIWNNWPAGFTLSDKKTLIKTITDTAKGYDIPVLINEEWRLLVQQELDGVHFDRIPLDYHQIKSKLKRNFIAGITCGNNLDIIHWAEKNDLDYISFCSIFSSASVESCEIVNPETIQKAGRITQKPVFLSGGITHENLMELKGLNFNGIAVISGILNDDLPGESARIYNKELKKLK